MRRLPPLLALLVLCCGRQGPLRLPSQGLPRPPRVEAVELSEREVRLRVRLPTERADGTSLRNLAEIRLERAPLRCPSCPPRWEVRVERALRAEELRSHRAELRDGGLRWGERYAWRVVVRDARGLASPPSSAVRLRAEPPPGAPQGLSVRIEGDALLLRWRPPSRRLDGSPLGRTPCYEVLRREDEGPWNAVGTVQGPRFRDGGVRDGARYRYRVRAWLRLGENVRLLGPFAEVEGRYLDLVPPPAPGGAVAFPLEEGMRLEWERSPEAAAYRVYRREEGGWRLLGETRRCWFLDREVVRGRTYRYRITAVDGSVSRNEGPPAELEAAWWP